MPVVYVVVATLALLVVWLYSLDWLLRLPSRKADTRARRRGGYIKPPASASTKDGGQRTPATDITARISSYSGHGAVSEGTVIRMRLAPPSKPIEPIWFIYGTGDPGVNGAPPESAA